MKNKKAQKSSRSWDSRKICNCLQSSVQLKTTASLSQTKRAWETNPWSETNYKSPNNLQIIRGKFPNKNQLTVKHRCKVIREPKQKALKKLIGPRERSEQIQSMLSMLVAYTPLMNQVMKAMKFLTNRISISNWRGPKQKFRILQKCCPRRRSLFRS